MKGETTIIYLSKKSNLKKIHYSGGEQQNFKLINYSPRQWPKLPCTYDIFEKIQELRKLLIYNNFSLTIKYQELVDLLNNIMKF